MLGRGLAIVMLGCGGPTNPDLASTAEAEGETGGDGAGCVSPSGLWSVAEENEVPCQTGSYSTATFDENENLLVTRSRALLWHGPDGELIATVWDAGGYFFPDAADDRGGVVGLMSIPGAPKAVWGIATVHPVDGVTLGPELELEVLEDVWAATRSHDGGWFTVGALSDTNVRVSKIRADGTRDWLETLGTNPVFDTGSGMGFAATPDGGVVAARSFGPVIARKYSSDGIEEWSHQRVSTPDGEAPGVGAAAVDAGGRIAIAGGQSNGEGSGWVDFLDSDGEWLGAIADEPTIDRLVDAAYAPCGDLVVLTSDGTIATFAGFELMHASTIASLPDDGVDGERVARDFSLSAGGLIGVAGKIAYGECTDGDTIEEDYGAWVAVWN